MPYSLRGRLDIPHGRSIEVEGIDLAKGTATFLRGPSGCGKTSVMRMLCGSSTYGGTLRSEPQIERLAFVSHDTMLVPWLSVERNVTLEARMRRVEAPIPSFEKHLQSMGMNSVELLGVRCGSLSLGMRQRIEIARAMAFRPQAMFLDEAWSGVDGPNRRLLFQVVDRFLTESGTCLLATTHADQDLLRLGDRLYFFDEDKVPALWVAASLARGRRIEMRVPDLWSSPEMKDIVTAIQS